MPCLEVSEEFENWKKWSDIRTYICIEKAVLLLRTLPTTRFNIKWGTKRIVIQGDMFQDYGPKIFRMWLGSIHFAGTS